jgi:hypothetical protein
MPPPPLPALSALLTELLTHLHRSRLTYILHPTAATLDIVLRADADLEECRELIKGWMVEV